MIDLKNFDEVYNYFRNTIKVLIIQYKLFDYENHILEKLWQISQKINPNKFKNSMEIDNYIFICLKNYCITLCKKENLYLQKNILCIDNSDFNHKSLVYSDLNYSMIIYNDLVSSLSHREKKIIDYKFKNNLSDIQIGEILGISRQAVNKSIRKSLIKLKQVINL